MADDADKTAERMEHEEKLRRLSTQAPAIEPTGFCLNCDEPLTEGRWCDAHCRDDWSKRNG